MLYLKKEDRMTQRKDLETKLGHILKISTDPSLVVDMLIALKIYTPPADPSKWKFGNITRETIWRDYQGNFKKIKDLDDTHLANILHYLNAKCTRHSEPIYLGIKAEIALRQLSEAFLGAAQMPHVNNEGKLGFLNYNTGRFEPARKG